MARLQYGRYEAIGLIASGGMADVYLGRARGPAGFERLVAIKVMHEHIRRDPEFTAMFLDEARLAARIRHPNVVPTLDVSEDGQIIVMDYVEGPALNQLLRRRQLAGAGCLPLGVTLRIVLDMLDGLQAAHDLCAEDRTPLNLVHRDVSPHNVLVGVDGVSRLTDFGIAYAESRLTSTRKGKLKGKMPYMSPEQLEGGEVDRRIDVYAAGCVLWEMLAGERLFQAANEAALACRVLAGPERSPRDVNGAVPPPLAAACMHALEERSRRYRSALEFCEALEASARQAGIEVARARQVGALARKATVSLGSMVEASQLSEGELGGDAGGEPSEPEAARAAPTLREPAIASEPPTRDARAQSATAPLAPQDELAQVPLAVRPVAAEPSREASTLSAGPEAPGARPARPITTLASEPSVPSADRTATDGSIVAPVSTVRSRAAGRWALAVTSALVLVAAGIWMVVRFSAVDADRGIDSPSGAASVSAAAASEPAGADAEPTARSAGSVGSVEPGSAASVPSASARSDGGTGSPRAPTARPSATASGRVPAGPRAATTGALPPSATAAPPTATVYHPSRL